MQSDISVYRTASAHLGHFGGNATIHKETIDCGLCDCQVVDRKYLHHS